LYFICGYLDKDGDVVLHPALDPLFQDHESLTAALAASIGGKIAFGPNAGNYVRKIGGCVGYEGEVPLAKGKLRYSVNGFSLIYSDPEAEAWASVASPQGDEAGLKVIDSNGTVLTEGDTVTLIKDLEVKGANCTAKRGTVVKNITLTDDAKYVEGKVNGIRIVLVAAYLKKA
jgi:alkylphosphonate utilization operon protein PhnA